MPKRERETFFNVRVIGSDGTAVEHLYKTQQEAQRLEASAIKQRATLDVTKGQAFVITTAESLEDIPNVIRDPQLAVKMFNYAVRTYQQGMRGRLMKDSKWAGLDGDCDLIELVQNVRMEHRRRRQPKDELAGFKKWFVKQHPDAPVPSDDAINRLLGEILAPAAQSVGVN